MLGETEKNQIKEVLRDGIANNELVGGNLLIIKDEEEVFYHEEGFADMEERIPVNRDSVFRLYSMTKPITATAVMLLVERGIIDLYDPVSKYISGFKNQMVDDSGILVPTKREVDIKDLLSMTSGLVYGGNSRAGQDTGKLFLEIEQRLFGSSPMSTLEIINKLGTCSLAFHPGISWEYGTSADVLGAIVEVVEGIRFGEFLENEIFSPLGMQDTGFWLPEEKQKRLVKIYEATGTGELSFSNSNYLGINRKMDRNPAFESGGAGLVSTIDDYARFAKMLLKLGKLDGIRILKPKTVKYLTSGTLSGKQQAGFDLWHNLSGHSYGNLMRVMTDCSRAGDMGSIGEYGWDGWLGSYFCNCPNDDLTILFMMQKTFSGTTSLVRKLRNIILSSY